MPHAWPRRRHPEQGAMAHPCREGISHPRQSEALRLAHEVGKREGHITVLFNNAGCAARLLHQELVSCARADVPPAFSTASPLARLRSLPKPSARRFSTPSPRSSSVTPYRRTQSGRTGSRSHSFRCLRSGRRTRVAAGGLSRRSS